MIPADLRIDHVFLVSCKYLSKVLLNAGPERPSDRLLVGESRSTLNWFAATVPESSRPCTRHPSRSQGSPNSRQPPVNSKGNSAEH